VATIVLVVAVAEVSSVQAAGGRGLGHGLPLRIRAAMAAGALMGAPVTFRQRDMEAAVRAVRAAGCEVLRVEVDKTGKIVVVTSSDPAAGPAGEERNEWDEGSP
jgi:hypothetical protein